MTNHFGGSLPRRHCQYWGIFVLAILILLGCGGDDTGYFLTGTILDGETLEPLGSAAITVETLEETIELSTESDGKFVLNPLPQGSTFQIRVRRANYRPLQYTAMPLPRLDDEEQSRTILRNIYLYRANEISPRIEMNVLPVDSSTRIRGGGRITASVVGNGLDPSLTSSSGGANSNALVSGAYRQPVDYALPNETDAHAQSVSSIIENGNALFEEGALLYGATYRAVVDNVPHHMPTVFFFTAIKEGQFDIFMRPQTSSRGGESQPSAGQEQYFTGRIYDGIRMVRVEDYDIRLEYHDQILYGQVDESGRYVIGPLLPDADYSVVIEAEGYRSFLSHNRRISSQAFPAFESLYFDAFLYPENVESPQATFRLHFSDKEGAPAGIIRLSPVGGSFLLGDDEELPAAIDEQIWRNSEDLQARSVTRDFADGTITFEAGALTMGVAYRVTVFGVQDYTIQTGTIYRSGVDGDTTLILSPVQNEPLQLIHNSAWSVEPIPSRAATLQFNQDIRLDPATSLSATQRILNDNFSIWSPDTNGDGIRNILHPTPNDSNRTTYRGVDLEVDGSTLTLTWDSAAGLVSVDPGDPIYEVSYGGLNSIWIHSAQHSGVDPRPLSNLVGWNRIDVLTEAN